MKTIAICACILVLPTLIFALDITDNGYTWRKCNTSEKMKVAKEIAFFFRTPASFWYGLFDSYYDTDKSEILAKSIIDVAFEYSKLPPEKQLEIVK
jgi:hypothetical protein